MHPFIAEALLAFFIGVEAIQLLRKDGNQRISKTIKSLDFGFMILGALFAITLIAHLTVDVRYLCVMHHNHPAQALHYRLASLWSHHETSLFVWLCLLNCVSSWVILPDNMVCFKRRLLAFINICLALYMCVAANPFASTPLALLHQESHGLNPLLYDLNMVWHPPLLYLGQVWLFVPYALALYAVRHRDVALDWILYHTKIGFGVLTIAIALGSFWAFTQLGWGGFWFWDPVETASLLPWLAALIVFHVPQHVLLKRPWLAAMPFVCVCISLWIIRSGILVSVHSFAKDAMAFWLLGAFACFVGLFVVLCAHQSKQSFRQLQPINAHERSFRVWLLTFGSWLLGGTLLIICLGLFIPFVFNVTLAPSFFNTVLLPLWAVIALLMALAPKPPLYHSPSSRVCVSKHDDSAGDPVSDSAAAIVEMPVLLDGHTSLRWLAMTARLCKIIGNEYLKYTTALLSVFLYLILYRDLLFPYIVLGACGALCAGAMMPFVRKRMCLAFAHMGVGFCLIGLASYSGNSPETTLVLNRGMPLTHGVYTLTFSETTREDGDFTSLLRAHIYVTERDFPKRLVLQPAKQYFHASQLQRSKADFGLIDRGKIVLITSIEPLTEHTMAITFHEKNGLLWLCLGVLLIEIAMLRRVMDKPQKTL